MEIKTTILWVLIIAYVIPGFIFGFKKLSGNAEATGHFKRWGYPLWTMHLLGFFEIACGVLLFFAETRMYGIIAYSIILAGALYTHIKANDPKGIKMKPVFVGVVLVGIFLLTIWK